MSETIGLAVGQHLKKLRKKHAIRQVALGEIIGIDQFAVSRVENGLQALTAEQWVRLCLHLRHPCALTGAVKKRMKLQTPKERERDEHSKPSN